MIFSAQPGYRVIAYRLGEDSSNLEFEEYDVIAWQTDKSSIVPLTTGDLDIAKDEESPDEGQWCIATPSGKIVGRPPPSIPRCVGKELVRTEFEAGTLKFAYDHDQVKYSKRSPLGSKPKSEAAL
jgi:hypothetical protein